jgi:gluconokinase
MDQGGRHKPLVVVMGVAGSGKSAVGVLLAERLGVAYGEADEFHPPANVDKMASGQPLTDEDREPWLRAIGAWLHERREVGAVASCSALRHRYRDTLRSQAPSAVFLHLAGGHDLIARRMAAREGHFMPTSLLNSQFDTLEPLSEDETGVVIDVGRPVHAIVEEFLDWWDRHQPPTQEVGLDE